MENFPIYNKYEQKTSGDMQYPLQLQNQQYNVQQEQLPKIYLDALDNDEFKLSPEKQFEIYQQEQTLKQEKIKKRKNFSTSFLLAITTILGLAAIGNKSSNKMAEIGQKVDDFFVKQDWYKNCVKKFSKFKTKFKDFFLKNDNKFIKETSNDFANTFKNKHARPKFDLARGYGKGFSSIFSITPVETIQTTMKHIEKKDGVGSSLKSLKKLVGENKADEFYEFLLGKKRIPDNREFCNKLTDAIATNFNIKDKTGNIDKKQLLSLFKDLQKGSINGKDFSEFTNIKMNQSGFIASWWPVNIVNSIGEKGAKLFNKTWKPIGLGNLGDSMIKYNAVNGTLADTKAGSIVQQIITVPTESISNFVNDKSGMGVLLGSTIVSAYNVMQDAPKGKKTATIADDFIGTIGSIAIATPLAFFTTYKIATLGNLEAKNWFTKILKKIGSIVNVGLDKPNGLGQYIPQTADAKKGLSKILTKVKNFGGATLRFWLLMFGLSGLFMKPVRKGIQKIFGKPHDPASEAAKKQELKEKQAEYYQELYNSPDEIMTKVKHNPKTAISLEKQLGKVRIK